MYKSVKDEDFFKCSAEELAQRLLGKVLSYNDIDYMITVTEAYPADDPFCYVNKKDEIFGKECLLCSKDDNVNEKKPGSCFVTPNGIHIIGGEFTKSKKNERAFDHVLIRGGIRVEEKSVIFENADMNIRIGRPYNLCHDGFNIRLKNQVIEEDKMRITDFLEIKPENIKTGGRIKLEKINDTNGKRYYFYPILELHIKEND